MRSDRLLLLDMLEAVDELIDVTPTDKAAFDADKLLRSHILRHIQIIGEATWRLSDDVKDVCPGVPWRQIAGMRHVLVHDYFQVNWDRVYQTALRDVPQLKPRIEDALRRLGSSKP